MPPPLVPNAPFDTVGPLNYLYSMTQGLTGMQSVFKGVPLSLPTTVSAYLTVGGQRVYYKATDLLQKEQRYMVTFGYSVAGGAAPAEEGMTLLIDRFTYALYADQTLGDTVHTAELDFTLADEPQYQGIAGANVRRYPIVVITYQQRLPARVTP